MTLKIFDMPAYKFALLMGTLFVHLIKNLVIIKITMIVAEYI